jgi:hypothetical protein
MKTHLKFFLLLLFVLPLAALAQKGGSPQKGGSQSGGAQSAGADCFKEWYTIMRERGAATVTDGTHDVIITLRNTQEGSSKCFMGRVEVAGGKMKRPIMVQKEDGSYEAFASLGIGLDPGFARSVTESDMNTITDGMSINFQMSDMEYGRIFFYTFINDKPKGLKQAPSPKALIKK